jgi:hypothetical protein
VVRIDDTERLNSGAVSGLEDEQASYWCFAIILDEGPGRDNLDPFSWGPVEVGAMGAIMLGPRLQAVLSIKGVDNEEHGRPLRNLLVAQSYTGQSLGVPVLTRVHAHTRQVAGRKPPAGPTPVSAGPDAAPPEKLEDAGARSVLRLIGNRNVPVLGPGETLL